jgi:hypothetical protein
MFREKKLLSRVVPPTSMAAPTSKTKMKLFGGVVPPKSTATPTVRKQEELLAGAVPPPSTATQTGRKKMGLLWGTVPSVSTATLKTETRKSKTECSTVQTSQTWNQESEVAKVKLQGKANSQEVFFLQSEISQARGSLQKSTKKNLITKKVSEMQKIWEQTNVSKSNAGPEISETSTICAKPKGGRDFWDQPIVLDIGD